MRLSAARLTDLKSTTIALAASARRSPASVAAALRRRQARLPSRLQWKDASCVLT
jgi:hypothetical protein